MQSAPGAVSWRHLFNQPPEITMNTAALTKVAISLGILYAVHKFVPNQAVKVAAMGAMGVVVAKQIPYVQEAL